ncbi:MAG TPA: MerR family transcriptional regulator [Solirubrobacteraceae bacterium]|nr:MerR family transcriptional regulator [Solirubrobacteraceae bacterium]
MRRGHGELLAGDAGELVGVSGTTIGQWARRGYIRASRSSELPHVYSVEDVGEAAIVASLLRRGVRHADIRRAIERLRSYGDWPLSEAQLATTPDARIVLREDGQSFVLTPRGWQTVAMAEDVEDVRLRLRHR